MNTTRRQSGWIVTLSLLAMAVAYVMLIWLPGHRAIKEMRDQLEIQRQFIAQAAGLSTSLVVAQQELEKAESVVTRWEKAAPARRDVSSLYGKINALARDARLVVGRFDPQPLIVFDKLEQLPLTVICSGTFAEIHEFLRKIEGLPATIWVDSMRLERTAQNAKDVQCELNLVVFSDNPQSSDYAKHSD
jgi:type IV pilus assembly protein PilO